jgi:hypothetical protein
VCACACEFIEGGECRSCIRDGLLGLHYCYSLIMEEISRWSETKKKIAGGGWVSEID